MILLWYENELTRTAPIQEVFLAQWSICLMIQLTSLLLPSARQPKCWWQA